MGGSTTARPVHVTGWESVYVLGLSVVSEGAALLTLGLVRPWGERVRAVPDSAAAGASPAFVPLHLGAALALIWGYAFRDFPNRRGSDAISSRRLERAARRLLRAAVLGRRCWPR